MKCDEDNVMKNGQELTVNLKCLKYSHKIIDYNLFLNT